MGKLYGKFLAFVWFLYYDREVRVKEEKQSKTSEAGRQEGRRLLMERTGRKLKKKGTLYLVQMALLIAIILLMAFTPIGYIRMPGLEITLIVVPVAVGAVLMGPRGGAVLGGVFGITSFIQCFGMSAFGAALLSINPFLTFLVCVPTRILAGWLAGLVFWALQKGKRTRGISYYVANLTCPICNTLFFMTVLCLGFFQTDYIQGLAGGVNVFAFVVGFVGINGLIEAAACFVVGSVVSRVLVQVLRHSGMKAIDGEE